MDNRKIIKRIVDIIGNGSNDNHSIQIYAIRKLYPQMKENLTKDKNKSIPKQILKCCKCKREMIPYTVVSKYKRICC